MAIFTLMEWESGNLSHCLKKEMCLDSQNVRELVSVISEVTLNNYYLVRNIYRPREIQNEPAPVLIF